MRAIILLSSLLFWICIGTGNQAYAQVDNGSGKLSNDRTLSETISSLYSIKNYTRQNARLKNLHPLIDDDKEISIPRLPSTEVMQVQVKRLDSVIIDEFDESGAQLNYSEKLFFIFDDRNRNVEMAVFEMKYGDPGWTLFGRTIYHYDSEDRKIQVIIHERDEITEDLVPIYRTDFLYPSAEQMITITYYYSEGQWREDWKEIYEIDPLGRLLSYTGFIWNDIDKIWDPAERFLNIYLETGQVFQTRYAYWDDLKSDFVESWMLEFQYDYSGNVSSECLVLIDVITGNLFTISKTNYGYDMSGRLIGENDWIWDDINKVFAKSLWRWYYYDENDNLTGFGERHWDPDLKIWVDEYRDLLEYNNNYERSDILLPGILTEELLENDRWFNHLLVSLEESNWIPDKMIWRDFIKAGFHYSDQTTNGKDFPMSQLKFYPNPTNNYLWIENQDVTNLEIFDLMGKKLFELKGQLGNGGIQLPYFHNGTYLLRFTSSSSQQYTCPLIIQNE